MEHWAPDLRDEDYWRGVDKILRRIEFACGLSYGILSESSEVAKTATEIIASKQRYYVTISTVQEAYKNIIKDTMANSLMLAKLITQPCMNLDYTIEFSVDDNILSTRSEKIEEKVLLFEKGLISKEEFSEWYKDM
jgi:A118 family predicted phage portal protein